MVPSDNNSASAGLLPFFDIVNVIEALPGISDLKLLSQIIVTDTSGVHHRFWREDVLDRSRDQNAYGIEFGNGHVLQHHERRFGQPLQQHR